MSGEKPNAEDAEHAEDAEEIPPHVLFVRTTGVTEARRQLVILAEAGPIDVARNPLLGV
jgi:hypothetical protein